MKIKQVPEDFIVKEITNVKIIPSGNYFYFSLKKREWNTIDAIKEIASRLGIKEKNIGFAGNKDKNAVTEQLISFFKVGRSKIEQLRIKDIKLSFKGYGNEGVSLGCLKGNKFVIAIRGLDKAVKKKVGFIPNYFDDQRFGVNGTNHLVGKALLKKDFKKACELLKLKPAGNDCIGQLRNIPKRALRFFINAYQSFLWNNIVAAELSKLKHITAHYSLGTLPFPIKEVHNKKVELPGFLNYKGYEGIFEKEGLTRESFVIRQMPELSTEGGERDMIVKVNGFKIIEVKDDELNKGKLKETVSFSLPKGSYATIAIKSLFANI